DTDRDNLFRDVTIGSVPLFVTVRQFVLGTNTGLFAFIYYNDTSTSQIYTLSLHDALPIYVLLLDVMMPNLDGFAVIKTLRSRGRSEEHTSELQSHLKIVCRLLLAKNHRAGWLRRANRTRRRCARVSRSRPHRQRGGGLSEP